MVYVAARERPYMLHEFIAHQGDPRPAIFKYVLQLRRPVHRIDGHDYRIRAQRRIEGDDELRTVLHIQDNPVTPDDAAVLLQKSRHRIDFGLQLPVADGTAVIKNGGLVRMAVRGDLEIRVQRCLRYR